MVEPAIKASYFAGNVKALRALGPSSEAVARERLRSVLTDFDSVSRLDWAPLAWDIELTRVCFDLGGMNAVREVNRRAFHLGIEGPLLRPLVTSAVSIFGLTPRTFLKFLAKGWGASTRDMGTIEMLRLDDGAAVLSFVGLPKEALDPLWLEGFCGIELAILDVTSSKGTAPSPAVVEGAANYELTWHR